MASSYRDLIVWQKGLELTKGIYTLTEGFPKSQQFPLSNQLLSIELKFATQQQSEPLMAELVEISKMLHVMIRNLKEAA